MVANWGGTQFVLDEAGRVTGESIQTWIDLGAGGAEVERFTNGDRGGYLLGGPSSGSLAAEAVSGPALKALGKLSAPVAKRFASAAKGKLDDAANAVRSRFGGGKPPAASSAAPDSIPTINGRKPINSKYAGGTHPEGVRFNDKGFPDFGPHSKGQVEIDGLTGNYAKDAALANKAAGLKKTPDGYVWHHVEDGRTLQLVPQDIHNAVKHTGGAAVIRNGGSFD